MKNLLQVSNQNIFANAPYIYPLTAVLIWTGNTLVTKTAATVVEPGAIAFYRWLLAGLVLTPFVLRPAWRCRTTIFSFWSKLALLGCLGMAAYQGLAYAAARTTSALNMGVIVASMPLFSALFTGLFAGEALTRPRIVGAIFSIIGLIILTTQGQPSNLLSGAANVGDVLMLVAVSSNALYGVLLKRWEIPLSMWVQLYAQIAFGIVLLCPFWWMGSASPITMHNAPLILYAGIPASIGAPFFWMNGIKRLGAVRASLFMNLIPIFVAIAAYVFLGESLHPYHALGGGIVLIAVWWGQR